MTKSIFREARHSLEQRAARSIGPDGQPAPINTELTIGQDVYVVEPIIDESVVAPLAHE